MKSRQSVFISYSHADQFWLDRLKVHLKPLERDLQIDIWQDTRIKPGSKWREEIQKAIDSAKIAVLLVSADFLASDFIANDELPPLLKAAEDEGAVILPVIVSPSLFAYNNDLSQFQAVNSLGNPLVSLAKGKQEELFLKIAEIIYSDMVAGVSEIASSDRKEKTSNGENFLSNSNWTKLIKIGNWILDSKNEQFIGAGMNNYILSRNEFGDLDFSVSATLKFSNFQHYRRRLPAFNGGFICGWKSEKSNPQYYNLLLTGTRVEFERIGFNGGTALEDVEQLNSGDNLIITEDKYYNYLIVYENNKISFLVDGKLIHSFDVPSAIIGRVGIRPWRSQVDCTAFQVTRK
ncbi:MAG: TIR domain-containing protein [Syntrophaceae bacterium]|nr:TIR domain-containing protein [Syntrophaceae bacterium]